MREKEQVKAIDLKAEVKSVIGQRFDAILNVTSKPVSSGNVNLANAGSSMSDTSLYMDSSSSMFKSCTEQAGFDSQLMVSLQDSVYHDALDQTSG